MLSMSRSTILLAPVQVQMLDCCCRRLLQTRAATRGLTRGSQQRTVAASKKTASEEARRFRSGAIAAKPARPFWRPATTTTAAAAAVACSRHLRAPMGQAKKLPRPTGRIGGTSSSHWETFDVHEEQKTKTKRNEVSRRALPSTSGALCSQSVSQCGPDSRAHSAPPRPRRCCSTSRRRGRSH